MGLPALARAADAPMDVATGAPVEQPIRVQYTAPLGCPDALSFFAHVRARTQRVRLAAPGEMAALVSVALSAEDGVSVGTLEMPDSEGKPFTRRVEATSCDEVALALSLVLALAYDPDAITTFPEGPAQPPPPPPQPPPSVTLVPPPPPPAPPPEASPFGLAFGMDAFLMSGIAPTLGPVFAPFIEYGAARDGGWTPRFSAALLVAPDRDVTAEPSGRTATLQFVGLRLLGCPASAELVEGLAVSPCLAVDGGLILGSGGSGLQQQHAGSIDWLSVAGLARVRWKIVTPLFVEVLGGGGPTVIHSDFHLHGSNLNVPNETILKVPDFFGEVGFGAGVHFP